MNITFCWTHVSGYMAACMRALARIPGLKVSVLAFESDGAAAPFGPGVMEGVECRLLSGAEQGQVDLIRAEVLRRRPDLLVISGWATRAYVQLAKHPALRDTCIVLAADTPARFDLRQRIAPLVIGSLLRRVDGIVVPGERGYQVMKFWGVPDRKLRLGLYGFDDTPLQRVLSDRLANGNSWPRRFLFVGRLVPEKGLEALRDAYIKYRDFHPEAWPLTMCGAGPLAHLFRDVPGCEVAGFVQPNDLPHRYLGAGAFLMPSLYEPWGVAIAEACASGLPIVCSQACGASAELVRAFHNGILVPTGDIDALANALAWIDEHVARLPAMGRASRELAAPFSAEAWADRWNAYAADWLRTGR